MRTVPMSAMLAAILLLGSSGAPTPALAAASVTVDPKKMSQAEIRAHNASLARTDPNYIRCVKSAAVGSLVARNFSCRTVAQWHEADRVGNEEARALREEMASKNTNTN